MSEGPAPLPPLAPDPEVLFQVLDGEAVLLHPGTGHYYGLDEVGQRFWSLLVAGRTPEETVEVLLAEYEVAESVLRSDLEALLGELREQRLVSWMER